jgi:hypothetical protein
MDYNDAQLSTKIRLCPSANVMTFFFSWGTSAVATVPLFVQLLPLVSIKFPRSGTLYSECFVSMIFLTNYSFPWIDMSVIILTGLSLSARDGNAIYTL